MAAEDVRPANVRPANVRPADVRPVDVRRAGAGSAGHRRNTSGIARKAVIGAVLTGYSWYAGSLAPFTTRSLVSVLLPGAILGAIAYGRPPERIPAPATMDVAGFSYWAIGVAAVFEWEASAFISGSHWWHPSLTELITPLIAPHPLKSAAICVWLLGGWALVRR